jgi:4-amino-4-deoxy-L-arabinose transferase-like glycosyltransferase
MNGMPWSRLVIAAVTVLLVAVRCVDVGAYPQVHPDEGFWTGGSRNLVRYGEPLMDGRLHPFLSPAHFVELVGFFTIATPSLISARMFSAVMGLATCALISILSRRLFPRRPWPFFLIFGFSSLTVLIQRVGLLEADLMFWLVLAATLWLAPGLSLKAGAGAAFGIALLVKGNSIYLLPAFLLTGGTDNVASAQRSWKPLGLFLLALGLVGGGGFLADCAIDPTAFEHAFRYEVDGQHFLDDGVLVHVGRFGLHPRRAWAVCRELCMTDPLLLVLAALGLWQRLRRQCHSTRADRFFAAWLIVGSVFHLSQIYVEHRYLTTLAPALAYFAACCVNALLDATFPWARIVAAGVFVLFAGYHATRFAGGLARQPNAEYWRIVAWISENVPHEARTLGSPVIGLSLPQRNYDYYRLVFPYDGSRPRALPEIVERYGIAYVLVDAEWHAHAIPDAAAFLAQRCVQRASVGGVEVYQVMPK